jgi:glycosyltransferase involved in cell wall biosynthesis
VSPAVTIPADIRFPLERANGVQIVKTAAALARAGHPTTLLVRKSDPRETREILALYGIGDDERLRVRRLGVGHRAGRFALPRLRFLARATATSLAALQRGEVVVTRDLQLADALLGLLSGAKVVYESHAVEALLYRERAAIYGTAEPTSEAKARRLERRERRVWQRAAGVVTTTTGIRQSYEAAFGARERTRVIPNGCDVPTSREFPGLARERPPRIAYAGQLYPWKGVDVLVEALAAVPDAELVVLGGLDGEPDFERVKALVAARGLGTRVQLRGTRPQVEVAQELARAAVVAVPFLKTGMTERHTSPIKAFEAMAAGRPIVASDTPSTREFLRPGENALLVPPGDPAALAAALDRVLHEPGLAESLARSAYAEAPRYSWDARARALGELLKEVA